MHSAEGLEEGIADGNYLADIFVSDYTAIPSPFFHFIKLFITSDNNWLFLYIMA